MKIRLFFLFYIASFTVWGQTIQLRELCRLPAGLVETSGLEITGPNQVWTHNDSWGEASIYAFDTLGNLTRSISLSNATNIDWEDMTKDTEGNLYVGDFGNNASDRKDLRIYKIPAPASFSGNSIPAGIIQFSYPDQRAFPPADNQKNFDMEALVFFQDSLYLFSKNQTVPFSGYTKMYRLPAKPGTYVATLVDSLYTGTDVATGQITAAALSPDKKRLALLSYSKLYVFSDFTGSNFFKGKPAHREFTELTQKEGICFADNCTVYLTDEEFLSTGGKLYKATICTQPTGVSTLQSDPSLTITAVYPNPASAQVAVQYQLPALAQAAWLLVYNIYGREVSRTRISSSADTIRILVEGWPAGVYFCRIETNAGVGYAYKLAIVK